MEEDGGGRSREKHECWMGGGVKRRKERDGGVRDRVWRSEKGEEKIWREIIGGEKKNSRIFGKNLLGSNST